MALGAWPVYKADMWTGVLIPRDSHLDCTISAPRYQSESAKYIHRPIVRHIVCHSIDTPSLNAVVKPDINNDPRVIDLQSKSAKLTVRLPEYNRIHRKGLQQFWVRIGLFGKLWNTQKKQRIPSKTSWRLGRFWRSNTLMASPRQSCPVLPDDIARSN